MHLPRWGVELRVGGTGPLCWSLPLYILQMAGMAGRIASVRSELQAALEKRCPEKAWSFVTQQIGMFSFTGMTPAQVWRDKGQVVPKQNRLLCLSGADYYGGCCACNNIVQH